jgi:hypothetical protein
MATPINMALYRYLVQHGASEAEAEQAASPDNTTLATKADLMELRLATKGDLAELKAELFRHTTQTLVWTTAIYGGIVTVVIAIVRWLP